MKRLLMQKIDLQWIIINIDKMKYTNCLIGEVNSEIRLKNEKSSPCSQPQIFSCKMLQLKFQLP